jgi:hypothetical protein
LISDLRRKTTGISDNGGAAGGRAAGPANLALLPAHFWTAPDRQFGSAGYLNRRSLLIRHSERPIKVTASKRAVQIVCGQSVLARLP